MTPAAGSITVPASIDATGTTDVSAALNAWIASQPDGSSLVFPDGSRYLLGGDAGLQLDGRSGLTLEGAGSTLLLRTNGVSNRSSAFFLQDSRHITIRGFTVDGGNEATGTTGAEAAFHEQMNGAVVRAGSAFVEFHGVTWDRLYGFGVFVGADGGTAWPEDISIHDSTIRGGEMGVAVVAGRRIRIVGNTINDSVYYPVDLEPDISQPGPNGEPGHGGGFVDVLIADNDIARYGWGTDMTSWFVAAAPQDDVVDTAVMDGLTITGNRVHVGPAVPTGRCRGGAGRPGDPFRQGEPQAELHDHRQLDGRRRRPPGRCSRHQPAECREPRRHGQPPAHHRPCHLPLRPRHYRDPGGRRERRLTLALPRGATTDRSADARRVW